MSTHPTPRSIAAQVLDQVSGHGQALDDALANSPITALPARDQALVRELCFGSLRWYWRLDALRKQLLRKPMKARDGDINSALLLGIYQLLYMRIPAHAAIHATVEVSRSINKPWARGLINGVLRRVQRDHADLTANIDRDAALRHAHPQWLLQRLKQAYPSHWQAIMAANNQHPPMSLRVNLRRGTRQRCLETLAAAGIDAQPHALADSAICLQKAMPAEQIPGFGDGIMSVQDIAAQLCPQLLQLRPGQRVLDACAAPGGKTGHLLESEPALTELVALDRVSARLGRLRDNLTRLHLQATVIDGDAQEPAQWWDGQAFDRILLDAPCSGTGVIRRHPDIKLLRRDSDIDAMAQRQAKILSSLWPLLAPGGKLLYVTCSLIPSENELVVGQFLTRTADASAEPLTLDQGLARPVGHQLLPGDADMDGFYFALLSKSLQQKSPHRENSNG